MTCSWRAGLRPGDRIVAFNGQCSPPPMSPFCVKALAVADAQTRRGGVYWNQIETPLCTGNARGGRRRVL